MEMCPSRRWTKPASRAAAPRSSTRGRLAPVKVGVVGLGAMGAGIAQLCVEAGVDTIGREVSLDLAEQARDRIAHFLTRKVEKGQVEQDARDAAVGRLSLTTELADFVGRDLVIEAI